MNRLSRDSEITNQLPGSVLYLFTGSVLYLQLGAVFTRAAPGQQSPAGTSRPGTGPRLGRDRTGKGGALRGKKRVGKRGKGWERVTGTRGQPGEAADGGERPQRLFHVGKCAPTPARARPDPETSAGRARAPTARTERGRSGSAPHPGWDPGPGPLIPLRVRRTCGGSQSPQSSGEAAREEQEVLTRRQPGP